MLVVKTQLKYSDIHGLGCFAGEDIKQGQLVWRFDEGIDLVFDEEALKKLPASFGEFIQVYAYSPMNSAKKTYILCADHARHMNHSEEPNLMETPEGNNVALKDIKRGEELTCDYKQFDKDASKKLGH
jgi:SET domain-containing protein